MVSRPAAARGIAVAWNRPAGGAPSGVTAPAGAPELARRQGRGGRCMLASLTDRVQTHEARSVRADSAMVGPGRRRVVAAFKHRLHAERAVGALLDIGFATDQI